MPKTREEDAAALERLRAGDREGAYRLVVEATGDSLYRFLLHMLRDEEAAREAFQDAYLRVFRALEGFRGDASMTTWVLTIGRNTALNRIRSAKTRAERSRSLEEVDDRTLGGTAPQEPRLTHGLLEALETLPYPQREAVLLFYVEDRPLSEISRITGRPVNTVKSDLGRARKRLRERLEDPQ